MTSKSRHDGYLLIDNRVSEGVPDKLVVANGMPVGAGRGLFEAATFTCSHCQAIVVKNPLRTRERGYCRGCDKYICDGCSAIRARDFECRTMDRVIDETLTAAERQKGS